ncbi:secondary thiamine-phosphate synthase enzyme YjbQ [Ancylobacter sp. MQZ15Z-1]|uniref:Secondary thiamine-phosphate synthase enzyme YjbQ n=1 Tax=Ancylobacter mangrovi TaxID=2972472 RepID=A0A9X2PCL1_9HYPH|nr:secondary thiamine-phosphate synthase enzyme YjbQ [Ancylobacter mangrovi]MCS0495475.1 secondary thiamine-phosphate synthase enzyme YjbQ [Ancylobacter mangrovi]
MAAIRQGEVRESTVARRFTTVLGVETRGRGFTDITEAVAGFLAAIGAGEGEVSVFCRHTSASLTIQENADPDVRVDLATALDRLAPEDAGWVHSLEGPDDMPAHVKAMLTGIHLAVPVIAGRMALGTWQGLYLVEHRIHAHRRELVVAFVGDAN